MLIDKLNVPSSLVEIVNITHKDGSPLEPDNWRQHRIGLVTKCCMIGGFGNMTPFFQIAVLMEDGEVTSVDLNWYGNASTGEKLPVEVAPGMYEFETNTSIYKFRVLTPEEESKVRLAIAKEKEAFFAMVASLLKEPDGSVPAS